MAYPQGPGGNRVTSADKPRLIPARAHLPILPSCGAAVGEEAVTASSLHSQACVSSSDLAPWIGANVGPGGLGSAKPIAERRRGGPRRGGQERDNRARGRRLRAASARLIGSRADQPALRVWPGCAGRASPRQSPSREPGQRRRRRRLEDVKKFAATRGGTAAVSHLIKWSQARLDSEAHRQDRRPSRSIGAYQVVPLDRPSPHSLQSADVPTGVDRV